ncbi:class I SAM-dependent methyltransferase [Reinekea sp. G2M2-21]|uniref:class I SAM-dependent methyltransferase n=1 Tax=Reinekea sp. G2M2-21 TaxID=2788942 RepID=UPI0018AA8E0C|nr:class I SAM-dependent methyltransferase [Reinekea sp. G2M2-21]
MKDIYTTQLTKTDIELNAHREMVGGLWDEIGGLHLTFLVNEGLLPSHDVLDIGCGCLRGGIPLIRYLENYRYYGIDKNKSLVQAGQIELRKYDLTDKDPYLIVNDQFLIGNIKKRFKYIISVSLFTHLTLDAIDSCLKLVREYLSSSGTYFSSFFLAPSPQYSDSITQDKKGKQSHLDRPPYHYSLVELKQIANRNGLETVYLGEWGHPRNQKMIAFKLA